MSTTVARGRSFLSAVRWFLAPLIILLLLAGCAVSRGENVAKIALLAPFEGRYREVGYNALYAARLALQEFGQGEIDLLAVDDGGTPDTAVSRARALRQDPAVKVAVVLGYAATRHDVQSAFAGLPIFIVGNWSAVPAGDSTFILSSHDLSELTTVPPEVSDAAALNPPIVGGEIFALEQFRLLRPSLAGITVVSNSRLPDTEFTARYKADNPFAPEPGLLATLTYDAVAMAIRSIIERRLPSEMTYEGINGTIRFKDGYWADAPVHFYQYDAAGKLVPQP